MSLPTVPPRIVRAVSILALTLLVVIILLRLPLDRVYYLGHPSSPSVGLDNPQPTDWSRFSYVQYVTNTAYLCNSIMLFESLHCLGNKLDRLMMYPSSFSEDALGDSTEGRLLRKARDKYGVKLMPIQVQSRDSGDVSSATWAESYPKLLAFNQTQYDRVLSLDSDSTILQAMDELFYSPPSPVAMPRAYCLYFNGRTLSSQMVLVQPSEFEFTRVMKAIDEAGENDYDMEILNTLYRDSALIIPHRPYAVLTGEFRSKKHTDYLGNALEPWDPVKTFQEAKLLHFSDWPVPKPWIAASPSIIQEKQPTCDLNQETGVKDDCRARDIWLGVYADFAERRKNICDMEVKKKRRSLPDRRLPPPDPHEPTI